MRGANINGQRLQRIEGHPTSCTVINVRPNGDRPCLHQMGASDQLALSETDLKEISQLVAQQVSARGLAIVHIGGTGLQRECPQEFSTLALLRALREACPSEGLIITLDLIAPHDGTVEILQRALPFVDYFMPSIEEAEQLSGFQGAAACAKHFLSLGVRRAVVLKSGGQGSYYLHRSSAGTDPVNIPACRFLERALPTSRSRACSLACMHLAPAICCLLTPPPCVSTLLRCAATSRSSTLQALETHTAPASLRHLAGECPILRHAEVALPLRRSVAPGYVYESTQARDRQRDRDTGALQGGALHL